MNKFIDLIISALEYIRKNSKLYITSFFNKTYFLIDKNFTLNKIYKPILKEKTDTNKRLQGAINTVNIKNKEVEKNISNFENENTLLQEKISIIEDLITKRYD
ncbi:hypothetical protein LL033_14880 [Clostridium estertheticum]|uniref:hypothetical protein n=1 Tax=Clostridium estertheticum TaxID=238834 RepID=UPI001C0DCA5F|nr:hypothetical protein [Clostridium estertheticum]MBU3216883.1 hypothetical protein [Clostridium estertheticum]WAG53929.1 hypothetical protein LL033_14880 [Clostridium estertheticum]